MAGQRTRNEFQLRMPGLPGVEQVATRLHCCCKTGQRTCDLVVVGKQFVQARYHRQRRCRLYCCQCIGVECIALFEAGAIACAQRLDQRGALGHVEQAEIAQHDRIGTLRTAAQRFEHIAPVPGGGIQHAHRLASATQACRRITQQLAQMAAADADAAPTDRVEIIAVDHAAQRPATTGLVAVDVIQRAAGIETGLQTQCDALGEPAAQAQTGAYTTPAQILQAVALRRPGQPLGLFETWAGTVRIA